MRAASSPTGLSLAGRYALFAVLAVLVNLGTQRAVFLLGTGATVFVLAVAAGTGTGLVTKYLLDKRWIFADRSSGIAAHGRRFGLYAATGLVTTAVFWGMETGFWLIWRTGTMREIGAVIGLTIGYVAKYFLDRRYVFPPSAVPEARA